jgi:rhamnose transport system substrate-binding protein
MMRTTSSTRTTLRLLTLLLSLTLLAAACGGQTQEDVQQAEASEVDGDTATASDTATPSDTATASDTPTASDTATAAEGDGSAEIPEDLTLAFLPKAVNNPYFSIASTGAQEATAEFGGEFSETGPSEASASSQVSYINTLAQQGSQVILTAANDPNAICPALNQAAEGGAAIVTFDSDAPECRDLFVNQADASSIAEVLLELMVEQLDGGEGQVAFLAATPNATNINIWVDEMNRMIAENEDFSGIEIVATAYGNDDDQDSFQETQALLQSYPDLDGIISPTSVGVAAAARYISDSEYKGEVVLTGLGTPNQMRQYIEDGTLERFALWNPEDLGYLAAWAGAHLAAGNITGEAGETFAAGRLGEYEILEDNEVILGPPTIFDESNIDDFDF